MTEIVNSGTACYLNLVESRLLIRTFRPTISQALQLLIHSWGVVLHFSKQTG
jgi:hypothetical protein